MAVYMFFLELLKNLENSCAKVPVLLQIIISILNRYKEILFCDKKVTLGIK